MLLESIDPKICARCRRVRKRRNIATTFAHMHNVRCMRLGMCLRGERPPNKLDRSEVTAAEAKDALAQSAVAMVRLIEGSLAAGGRVPDFRPDVVALVCASVTHDRIIAARSVTGAQLGAPLTPEQGLLMWEWDKLERNRRRLTLRAPGTPRAWIDIEGLKGSQDKRADHRGSSRGCYRIAATCRSLVCRIRTCYDHAQSAPLGRAVFTI